MMGVGPGDARSLTIWEFTAMRTVWNARHKRDGDDDNDPVAPPSEEFVRESQADLLMMGIAGSA